MPLSDLLQLAHTPVDILGWSAVAWSLQRVSSRLAAVEAVLIARGVARTISMPGGERALIANRNGRQE